MKAFLKENAVLIAGISLPVLLTLIFFFATQVEWTPVPPPKYQLVFATDYQNRTNNPYQIVVQDSQVRFRYFPPTKERDYGHWNKPRLYVYRPKTDTSQEIVIPSIDDPDKQIDVVLPELATAKISPLKESPDGYSFEYEYGGNRNLMTEIFGGGHRSRSNYVLRKGSYKVVIPKAPRYNSEFIGWILEE
ncbi:MAG: hypothetical protein KDJ15_02635 [Alphaproteobacteria bacterium]|nr:hypothetical protein [Alphaproteobacteria bacterium]